MPNIPSLPTNAPRRSNPSTSGSSPPSCTTDPSLSTTSSPRMCEAVTPSLRQCGPPELFATLPPMEQLCWLLGSGAKCRPRCATWRVRSRFSTPGSTHAMRFTASTDSTRFIFVVAMTSAWSNGVAPPASPVPAPRATNGTPCRTAATTAACTSAVVNGKQTTPAVPSMFEASRRYSPSSVLFVRTRSGASAARRSAASASLMRGRGVGPVAARGCRGPASARSPGRAPRAGRPR